jgi:diguanylate cyclase (GGDEF)-like protein
MSLLKRATLVQKLILSYAAMTVFTVAALGNAIMGLYALNRIAGSIVTSDLVAITTVGKLRDSLLAQEGYVRKFIILNGSEFERLFRNHEQEFQTSLDRLKGSGPDRRLPEVLRNYRAFREGALILFEGGAIDQKVITTAADRTLAALDGIIADRQRQLGEKMADADRQRTETVRLTLFLSFAGFLLAVSVAGFFAFNIYRSITKLKKATHRIAEGDFDFDPQIPPSDEFGELARDFTTMAAKLKVLEEVSLDASPLTRLPGNIAIERSLNRRLKAGESFALCYVDLDNFKSYNDRYGYVPASDIIKMTGEIIYTAVKEHGDENDFVGHIGGDDFVMIIASDKIAPICDTVIQKFTGGIREFYSEADLAAGSISGVDRYGVPREFPIMTISIAVLDCRKGDYASAADIARAAAEIKDQVKVAPGSNYFIHRR